MTRRRRLPHHDQSPRRSQEVVSGLGARQRQIADPIQFPRVLRRLLQKPHHATGPVKNNVPEEVETPETKTARPAALFSVRLPNGDFGKPRGVMSHHKKPEAGNSLPFWSQAVPEATSRRE